MSWSGCVGFQSGQGDGADERVRSANAARPRARHLLGSSCGVGVRLIRPDRIGEPTNVGVLGLAGRLAGWLDALTDRDQPL